MNLKKMTRRIPDEYMDIPNLMLLFEFLDFFSSVFKLKDQN